MIAGWSKSFTPKGGGGIGYLWVKTTQRTQIPLGFTINQSQKNLKCSPEG